MIDPQRLSSATNNYNLCQEANENGRDLREELAKGEEAIRECERLREEIADLNSRLDEMKKIQDETRAENDKLFRTHEEKVRNIQAVKDARARLLAERDRVLHRIAMDDLRYQIAYKDYRDEVETAYDEQR